MPTVTSPEVASQHLTEMGVTEAFEHINSPGCYILRQFGALLRVPEEAISPGRSPTIDLVSRDQWLVTKISNDPWLPLGKARTLAADLDLRVNF